jgi:hypothetical protein
MLFDAAEKWWHPPGLRHSRHEGIDLCFLEGPDGALCRLDPETGVPMAEKSRVVHILDDFLGQTVVTSRKPPGCGGRELLTLYAHIRPEQRLSIGDRIPEGEVFARIAPVDASGPPLMPHLHISMAWADHLPPCTKWSWKLLNACGSKQFIDPLAWLDLPCRIIDFPAGTDPAETFPLCR